jgi:hypothetical protein
VGLLPPASFSGRPADQPPPPDDLLDRIMLTEYT